MKPLLLHLLKVIWRARVAGFWPIWTTLTFAAAVVTARAVRSTSPPFLPEGETNASDLANRHRPIWSRGGAGAVVSLLLFLACYVGLTLVWEDFAYYDNDFFTLYTLKGQDLIPSIWPQNGRFFPLGHQEFNLVRHLTSTVFGYHVFPILQVLGFSFILLALDEKLSIIARASMTAFVLAAPALVISFGGLIYDERNLLFWLACLLFCVKGFDRTPSAVWAAGAAACAQIMIYYKEVAFLLLLGFAIGRLILRCKVGQREGWDFSRMRTKEARLDLCLVSLCLLFVLYYLAAMLPHPNLGYASGLRLSLAQVLLSYLKLDLGAWILVAFFVRRMYLVLQGRVAPSPYWDGLAIGGVAYFGAYLLLRMYAAYYLAPVDLIAVLYVGRSMVLAWREVSPQTKVVAVGLLLALFIQNVSLAAFRVYERKNVIHGKAEIARIIEAQFQKPAKPAGRLFFPFASPYVTMEYAAYLNYRGVPVEGGTQESAGRGRVAVVSRAAAKDSPCMGYTSLLCRNGQRPVPGDLVIVLPDDEANLADVKLYQDQAQPLFSYDPRPRMAPWLDALIRHFHIVSPHFSHKELPDRWLMASVTVWR